MIKIPKYLIRITLKEKMFYNDKWNITINGQKTCIIERVVEFRLNSFSKIFSSFNKKEIETITIGFPI